MARDEVQRVPGVGLKLKHRTAPPSDDDDELDDEYWQNQMEEYDTPSEAQEQVALRRYLTANDSDWALIEVSGREQAQADAQWWNLSGADEEAYFARIAASIRGE